MTVRRALLFAGSLVLACSFSTCSASLASAQPVTTAWLEDVHVEAAGETETVLTYEYETADLKASAEGYDELGVGLHAGLNHSLTLAPEVAFRQRGEEPLRLDEVGVRLRWRAIERFALPKLMLYGGYGNDLGEAHDHVWVGGASAGYELAWLFVNADVRPSLNLGGALGTSLEMWSGLALGYGWRYPWSLRAGVELFAVIPVVGERSSDLSFGASGADDTYYYGPSFAFAMGPFWTALSAVSGYGLSDAASQLMLRGMVGVTQ